MSGLRIMAEIEPEKFDNIEFMEGKTYDKVFINYELWKNHDQNYGLVYKKNNILVINHECTKMVGKANTKIRILDVHSFEVLKLVAKSLLDGSEIIRIRYVNFNDTIPEHLEQKIRLSIYIAKYKKYLKPKSTYLAFKLSDLYDLNWSNVSTLMLNARYDDMVDMIKYISSDPDIKFKEIVIKLLSTLGPYFDLSLLADIQVRKIIVQNGVYANIKKLLKWSNAPCIQFWTPNIIDEDPFLDISDNYTLLDCGVPSQYEEEITSIIKRNRGIHKNMRFTRTKNAAVTE